MRILSSNQKVSHINEFDEIVSKPPKTLLRLGTVVILVAFSFAIVLSTIIKYPQIIKVPFKLTSIEVGDKEDGLVQGQITVLGEDAQKITKGTDILLSIWNKDGIKLPLKGKITMLQEQSENNSNAFYIVMINFKNYSEKRNFTHFNEGEIVEATIITENLSLIKRVLNSLSKWSFSISG